MKNKKGFTLVELLAVIAILAVLMLLIMPNILKLFSKGKKDAFKVQVQNIIKIAQTQKQTDSMKGKNPIGYCDGLNLVQCTEDVKLDVSDSDVKYGILLDEQGLALGLAVENSNFCYVNINDLSNIDTDDFVEGGHLSCTTTSCTCSSTTNQGGTSGNYKYWDALLFEDDNAENGKRYYEPMNLDSYPANAKDDYNDIRYNIFFRTSLDSNNQVTKQEICINNSGSIYCKEDTVFNNNPSKYNIFFSEFTSVFGSESDCESFEDSDVYGNRMNSVGCMIGNTRMIFDEYVNGKREYSVRDRNSYCVIEKDTENNYSMWCNITRMG